MTHRTTVSIPLFEAGRWLPVVRANLERLAGHADIVVSDATGSGSSLDALRAELDGVPEVTFLGRRDVPPGWVAHCNDLLERSTSELHMWLPQDDEIGPEWIRGAEQALDAAPSAVLAVGPIERVPAEPGDAAVGRPERGSDRLVLHPDFGLPALADRVDAGLRECLASRNANLGLVFRAVVRRDRACPLPLAPASGAWVDVLWALRMLTRGTFVPIEGAVYRKRWYPTSAHAAWRDLSRDPALRETYLPEVLADLAPGQAEATLQRAWTTEAVMLREELDLVRTNFEQSVSWRITGPLRRARAGLRERGPRRD